MKTILLVDDEPPLRLLVHTTLTDPGLRILEASDGLAAAKLALDERPDLIVLDWMMPKMNGIDLVRMLRHNPVTADTPIIMLTARGQEADRQQAHAAGVEAYLVKPFSPLELIKKVQAVLGT
jgi:two-component system phosphate regulon response regulator PhoB